MEELDLNKILKADNNRPVKIGELTPEVIELLKLDCLPKNILLTPERIYHCENHKFQYKNEDSYLKSMHSIPKIISQPDYIGFNLPNNSIQYVKKLDDATLVAVKISQKGALKLRTVFPLTDFDLNKKIKSGKLIPFK